ncbi:MAG: hypothetical protein FJ280_08360 [Planctomycetes bacterium]|nr:hypothetical protein [Planctomycetota bacterium]
MPRGSRHAAAVSFLVSLVLLSCERTDRDWRRTKLEDSAGAYANFLTAHPQGAYADSARYHLSRIAWTAAQKAGDAKSLREFLQEYPDTRFSEVAQAELETLEWRSVSHEKTDRAYRDFVRLFPHTTRLPRWRGEISNVEILGRMSGVVMNVNNITYYKWPGDRSPYSVHFRLKEHAGVEFTTTLEVAVLGGLIIQRPVEDMTVFSKFSIAADIAGSVEVFGSPEGSVRAPHVVCINRL